MTLPPCPDPERLAACAEGGLDGEERDDVLRHLTRCHDCYVVFTETLRSLDETERPAVPDAGRATAPALGSRPTAAPSDGATPTPGDTSAAPESTGRAHEPRDNVIPFDRRRWRRVATLALPLAAAVAVAIVTLERVPQSGAPSIDVARAPSPSPVAPPTPPAPSAASQVHVTALPEDWLLPRPARRSTFGVADLDTRCLYVGLLSVDIEAARVDPALRARLLRNTGNVVRRPGGDALSAEVDRLSVTLREGSHGALRPTACPAALLDVGRAVELVRLAALTHDAALLRHTEVVEGLAAGRSHVPAEDRQDLDDLARHAAAPPEPHDAEAWQRLRLAAERLALRWQP